MLHHDKDLDIKLYIVHNTAVPRTQVPLQLESVDNFHREKDWGGGWKQPHPSELGYYVGYNLFTEGTGETTQCRVIGEETIANKGHNCAGSNDCDAISHCFAGYFKVEDMTAMQVQELREGFLEAKAIYPDIRIVQHSDVQPGRTCAELSTPWLEALVAEPTKETKNQIIARLTKENMKLKEQVKQLIGFVTSLIKRILNK